MAILINDSERRHYLAQVSAELKSLAQPLPKTIWHYTSGAGLIAIVRSGTIWTTHVSCLNDASEVQYSTSLLADAVGERWAKTSPRTNEDLCLYDALSGRLPDDVRLSRWFVGCFTTKCDDLSQWRAYSGGEGGYAIGFDTTATLEVFQGSNCILSPVIYDRSVQLQTCQRMVDVTFGAYKKGLADRPGVDANEWATAFVEEWFKIIEIFFPIFKDGAFSDESEWRIIRSLQPADLPTLVYQQRRSMMTRHLPMTPNRELQGKVHRLPISEIVVGPSRHNGVSHVSVNDLLRSVEYPDGSVYVRISGVPFQTP